MGRVDAGVHDADLDGTAAAGASPRPRRFDGTDGPLLAPHWVVAIKLINGHDLILLHRLHAWDRGGGGGHYAVVRIPGVAAICAMTIV